MKKLYLSILAVMMSLLLVLGLSACAGDNADGEESKTENETLDISLGDDGVGTGEQMGDNGNNDDQQPGGNENQTPGGNENQTPGGNENQTPGGNENQTPGGNENQTPGGNENEPPQGGGNQPTDGDKHTNSSGSNGDTGWDDLEDFER